MLLCEDNHTYILQDPRLSTFLEIKDGNRLYGWFGKIAELMLTSPEKRICKFIGGSTLNFGSNDKQNTGQKNYTGVLGLIQRNEGQIYLNPEVPFVSKNKWLAISETIITSEKFFAFDDLTYQKVDKRLSNLLDTFDSLFFIYLFLSVIIFFIILSILKGKTGNLSSFIRTIFAHNLCSKMKRSVKIFKLFYVVYFFFLTSILLNTIKTEKVIVDQSFLIKDSDDILHKTKKVCCFLRGMSEHLIAISYPKENILRIIYDTKSSIEKGNFYHDNATGKCILRPYLSGGSVLDFKNKFLILKQMVAYLLIEFYSQFKTNLTAWLSTKPIYQANLHIYYRNDETIKSFFDKLMQNYVEMGLWLNLHNLVALKVNYGFRKNNVLYNNIDDYVKDHSTFDDLEFENFKMIFFIYFTVCLIIFCVHWLVYFSTKKDRKKKDRKKKNLKKRPEIDFNLYKNIYCNKNYFI